MGYEVVIKLVSNLKHNSPQILENDETVRLSKEGMSLGCIYLQLRVLIEFCFTKDCICNKGKEAMNFEREVYGRYGIEEKEDKMIWLHYYLKNMKHL